MDVRCERCNAQYAVDDGLVQEGGLAVRCAMCGHSFKVMKTQGRSLRKTSGDVYPLPDSATLQRWVVEGRVTREDEIAEPGQPWVKAGQLKDLEPFFSVVDQARRSRSGPHASPGSHRNPQESRDPRTPTGELVLGSAMTPPTESWQGPRSTAIEAHEPAWAAGTPGVAGQASVKKVHVQVQPEKPRNEPKGRPWTLLLFLFVVLIVLGLAMGATFYVLKPDMVPAEFSKFIKDWNTWSAGSEKLSRDGAARALAPLTPGARPGQGTTKPPAPLLPMAPLAPTAPAPPPQAPQAKPAEGALGAGSPAAAPAPTPENPAPTTTAPPSGQVETATPKPTEAGVSGKPANGEGTPSGPAPSLAAGPGPAPAEAPPSAASPPVPESGTPGTPSPATAPAVAAPRPAAVPPAEKRAPAAPGPKNVTSLLAQARQQRDSGRASQALDTYGRALQANPKSADAQAGRGLAYLDLSRYRQAEESFKEALELNPSHSWALMGLAETYRYQGKRSDAVVLYRKYLASHPKGEDATAARKAIQALEESP